MIDKKNNPFCWESDRSTVYFSAKYVYTEFGPEKLFPVKALYINPHGRYGEYACVVTENFVINLPHHMTEKIRRMIESKNVLKKIYDGRFYVFVKTYRSPNFGEQYTVDFKTMYTEV